MIYLTAVQLPLLCYYGVVRHSAEHLQLQVQREPNKPVGESARGAASDNHSDHVVIEELDSTVS